MNKYIRIYCYLLLVCFIVNVTTMNLAFAFDVNAMEDMLMSPEVVNGVFGDQIAVQSESGDLTQQVAPPPRVITTSNGDLYIYSGEGASAQVSKTSEGYTEVTYSLNGATIKVKNDETGESLTYKYELDGATVKLYNDNGALVETRSYSQYGQILSTAAQGTITYEYGLDKNNVEIMVSSTDQWGNKTVYDSKQRPDYIMYTNMDGTAVQVGDYTYNSKGMLSTFTDQNGNTTHFEQDGIRPSYVTNLEGTITKTFQYDTGGILVSVTDVISNQITTVSNGYYTTIYDVINLVDADGNEVIDPATGEAVVANLVPIGAYNYDSANRISSITNLGAESVITGWTDYNEFGQVSGTYNQEGVKIQEYEYNDHGFLQQTFSLGAINSLGYQERTSMTLFDGQGRPNEVWQLGDGGNKVKIQEYAYKENGVLANTYSLGIIRNTNENDANYGQAILDVNGDFQYITTSITAYDKKGRPEAVYALVRNDNGDLISGYDSDGNAIATTDAKQAIMEKQQSYKYNKNGFLAQTVSYGFGGKVNGTTNFDRYSRPTVATNGQGSDSQMFVYSEDGFLTKTLNKGENGVTTGYTLYNDKGKPTDVYNHEDSSVQKYVYDECGMLVQSFTMSAAEGVNGSIASTMADQEAILALWDDSYTADAMAATGGNLSDGAFVTAMFTAANSGNTDLTEKIALTIIMWFSDGAKGGNEYLINSVGTAYHMLGQSLEKDGNSEAAISAYKVQISEFGGAMAYNAAGTAQESVTSWSVAQLSNAADRPAGDLDLPTVNLPSVTGYTVFGGDGKPMASFSMYEKFDENGASLGIQTAKTQEFSYAYQETEKQATGEVDANGRAITVDVSVTKFSNFVQKTSTFGDFYDSNGDGVITTSGANKDQQAVTGYTTFDSYGRQNVSYFKGDEALGETDQVLQKYNYSAEGFLSSTISYGKNKKVTGVTVFDNYSRPVAAYNSYGSAATKLPDDLVAALSAGLTAEDLDNPAWQPYLKGVTQTFVYGDDGFLESSQTWGEATVIDVARLDKFSAAVGSVRGDKLYSTDFDFNDDGAIDATDQSMFEASFNGSTAFSAAFNSVAGDANYSAGFDYDSDGDIDRTDLSTFNKTTYTDGTAKYMPTYTGKTEYDKYGKATSVENAEGIVTQQYVYNERGFMTMSESYGAQTDENGNIMLTTVDGVSTVNTVRTGYTEFNEKSKPVATYSVYNDGTNGEQSAKVQEYEYENGFMVQTNNFGRNEVDNGYTTFDDYGRQQTTYNDSGSVVSKYAYSNQGFLKQTNNYGLDGAYTGKTIFNKMGRPTEAFNMAGSGSGLKGLTQTFEYNDFGFLASSTSYGENQAMTGKTVYDGYGKALRGENDMGITVSSYDYDSQGFMTKTTSLAFVQDGAAAGDFAVDVTHNNLNDSADTLNGTTEHGFYAVTGYTMFDDHSRPTESYQCYWDTQGEGQGALVQTYNYDTAQGFLTSTTNYGKDGVETGTTQFDKYGRQLTSMNEFGETTTKYKYSSQGFMDSALNYGLDKASTGKTVFNDLGRPETSYNSRGALVQDFNYNSFTGSMESSKTYGEPTVQDGVMAPTFTGLTTYDAYGKAVNQTNEVGSKIADYAYDAQGFMTQANSYGNNEVLTGYTAYNGAGRPVGSYTVSESGTATKVQDFIYNTNSSSETSTIGLVGQAANTGFLTATVSYGDNNEVSGYTTFNKYGQQEKSYNELGEKTTAFAYSRAGFMSQTSNYGINNTYTGKTVFNEYGRPVAAYNERNAVVQDFQYNANGFLASSTSYGDGGTELKGPVTGTTYYNDYGKQTHTTNAEGYTVSSFEYNDAGFMTKSINLAFQEDSAATGEWAVDVTNAAGETQHGIYQVVGYTTYDAKSRPVESYSVYNNVESLSQRFVYSTEWDGKSEFAGSSNTGFVTGAVMYSMDTGADKAQTATGDDVSVYTGTSVYNKYGRPEMTYNQLGIQTSKNYYTRNGFIDKTVNYGEDKAVTGTLKYDNTGRPTESLNYKGVATTQYFYNDKGQLAQTVNFNNGVKTSYTTFDVFSKATATYQLYEAGNAYTFEKQDGTTSTSYMFVPGSEGGIANYTVNDDGSIASGGFKNQDNTYNIYGGIDRTNTYGREGGLVSHINYDAYSRPNEVWNHVPGGPAEGSAVVQKYSYSDQGFLASTTSYSEMEELTGVWSAAQTTTTFFNKYGQQTESYLMVGNVTDGFTQGALQAKYSYDGNGFLSKSVAYNEGTVTATTYFDASGRQKETKNASNGLATTFYYDLNGFMLTTASQG
ncbi:MAG: hypothetical protein KJ915_04665 [Candidatus Omnitrophica bacterium]|nr:hypothetical protein [Candidatus Omnitrophota bacterium]